MTSVQETISMTCVQKIISMTCVQKIISMTCVQEIISMTCVQEIIWFAKEALWMKDFSQTLHLFLMCAVKFIH